jgi:hypothetical protein
VQGPNAKDHVLLSVTNDARYVFFAPLTALAWVSLGFHPVVFLVGESTQWSAGRARVAAEFLYLLEKEGVVTVIPVTCSRVDSIFVSQMIRLFGVSFGALHPDSWTIINDIDMWPLWRGPYIMGKDKNQTLSNNAGCCGDFAWRSKRIRELPMGTVGMRVRQWRDLMQIPENLTSAECVIQLMRTRATHLFGGTLTIPRGPHWRDDQQMLSILLFTRRDIVSNTLFVGRGSRDRIDRADWPPPKCLSQMARTATDAHLPFPGESHWIGNLKILFRSIVGQRYWTRADAYFESFVKK